MAPGRVRIEYEDGQVQIGDVRKRRCMLLNAEKKTANVWDLDDRIDKLATEDPLETLREEVRDAKNRPDGEVEELGTKQIDGRWAVGFRFELKEREHKTTKTIWADRDTGLPIQIEEVSTGAGPWIVVSRSEDYQCNVKLDDSLFDIEPPKGYTVQRGPPE